jgi:hypothetical protein
LGVSAALDGAPKATAKHNQATVHIEKKWIAKGDQYEEYEVSDANFNACSAPAWLGWNAGICSVLKRN